MKGPLPPSETRGAEPPEGGSRRTGFWLYASHLYTVFGIALSNGLLLLTLASLPWTARPSTPETWRRLRRARPLLTVLGVYLVLLMVAIGFSYDPRISFDAHSDLLNLAPLPLALLLVRGERDLRRLVDGLVIVGGVVAVAALAQLPIQAGGGAADGGAGLLDLDQRIRGPFSHYMTLAGFLLVCDLLLLASMVYHRGWRQPWRWGLLALLNLTLLVNQSRNAWVALVVVGSVVLVARRRRFLLALPLLAVALVLLAPAPLLVRMASVADPEDPSNYDRICMLEAGLHMVAERPVTGIGPDMVEERYPIYRPPTAPRFQRPHLHNSFLQLAAERGLPSLAAYVALMGLALGAAWRGFRREGGGAGPRADLYVGMMAVVVAFNLAGLFENNWGDTEVQRAVVALLALPFCLEAGGERRGGRAADG